MNQSRWADPPPVSTEDRNVAQSQDSSFATPAAAPSESSNALPFATLDSAPPSAGPPPDVSSADTFAQTGPQQDALFDDVTPAEESMRIRSDDDLFSDDVTPATQPVIEHAPLPPQPSVPYQTTFHSTRARGDGSHGRPRGRGRGFHNNRNDSSASRHVAPLQGGHDEVKQASENAPENAPSGPRKETVPSVRGDRHGTGGVKKPKLTEDELAEKLARIQIQNASLAAAHARAEADAASFAERESQAKVKADQRRKEERKDRQQMMGEREKNRMRKLKAMEGREWDSEKQEDDFRKGGRFDKPSGYAGDRRDYNDGREYLYQEPRAHERGGRGVGRAGRGPRSQAPSIPKQEDFPALPAAVKDTAGTPADAAALNAAGSGKSWAEQMESAATT